jgi:hypothetical protein
VPADPLLEVLDQVRGQLAAVQAQLEAVNKRTLEQAAFARVLEKTDRYLTFEEAGVILGVDRRSIDRALMEGKLPRVLAPGTKSGWRVPLSAVRRLQKNQTALAEMERRRTEQAVERAQAERKSA